MVSSVKKINVDVPVIMKVTEGNVPSYYFDGYLDTIVNKWKNQIKNIVKLKQNSNNK